MSKFVDRLQSLSKSSTVPIGFHPSVSEVRGPSMLLVVELSGTQVKEAKVVAEVSADAGLIISEGSSTRDVGQMVEALGNVPLGVFVRGMNEKEVDELVSLGCDFVVFDAKAAAGILSEKKVGKFLIIEPSLDQGLVRAINSLEVDGVFISRGADSSVAVEHLLVYRRFVELLEKPVIITLPSLATKEELTSLRQAGVSGVIAASGQSFEALAELKKTIDSLPRGVRVRRSGVGVVLPQYGGSVVDEEDEDQ
jgi:hypothetical protein